MKFIQNVINYKINIITAAELLKYANQFNVAITKDEAERVAAYLRGKHFDVFNDQQRTKLVKEVAKMTSPETAREVNRIFIELTK